MTLAFWLFAGGAVGVLNALTIRWAVGRLRPAASRHVVLWVTGTAWLRWGLAAGVLVAALQRGIVPGLLAFVGLWLARWSVMYKCQALE
jgi:hypothetical protein